MSKLISATSCNIIEMEAARVSREQSLLCPAILIDLLSFYYIAGYERGSPNDKIFSKSISDTNGSSADSAIFFGRCSLL